MSGKVKIITAGMWYKGKVGQTFNVVDEDDRCYLVEVQQNKESKTRQWVRKKDVEVLEPVEIAEKKAPQKKQGGGVFSKDGDKK